MGKGTSTSLLFLLAMAMVALFGASEVMAQFEAPPLSCTTGDPEEEDSYGYYGWEITAIDSDGAPVSDNAEFPFDFGQCVDDESTCREYRYSITSLNGRTGAHAVTLINHDQQVVTTDELSASFLSEVCAGDSATGVGSYDCASQALRLNPNDKVNQKFSYLIAGESYAVSTTVVVQSGNRIGSCRIAGAGRSFQLVDPNQALAQNEIKQAGPCTLELTKNLLGQITGVFVKFDESEFETCLVTKPGDPITDALLCTGDVLDPDCTDAASGLKFAAGEAASGDNSCYNFFSYGRWYQVCW